MNLFRNLSTIASFAFKIGKESATPSTCEKKLILLYLNLSYIQLTIASIIKHCGSDFKICLIDDTSFKSLIPEWKHNLEKMGSPVKEKVRLLAKLKLVKYL